jgi:hypothetical protein
MGSVRRLKCFMPKPLVTFIKFRAPFPRTRGDANDTPGGDLVNSISEQLAESGIVVNAVKRTGDWKWEISSRIGYLDISTLIGVVDDFIPGPVNQWIATHNSNVRLPWKFVPYSVSQNRHVEDHERYCKSFYEIAGSIDGLGNVIWYNTTSMGIRDVESNSG